MHAPVSAALATVAIIALPPPAGRLPSASHNSSPAASPATQRPFLHIASLVSATCASSSALFHSHSSPIRTSFLSVTLSEESLILTSGRPRPARGDSRRNPRRVQPTESGVRAPAVTPSHSVECSPHIIRKTALALLSWLL